MPRHSPCALYCFTICFMFLSSLRNDCFLILVVFYPIKLILSSLLVVSSFALLLLYSVFKFLFSVPENRFQQQLSLLLKSIFSTLVGTNGLEPSTSRLSGVRSNHLSYAPIFGGDEEDRTPDPLRARQVLSQLSYTPKYSFVFTTSSKSNNASNGSCWPELETFMFLYSLERRWSSRTFWYGYLVTTSPQSLVLPSTAASKS